MYSKEAASQWWCRFKGDKGTETERRATTTACADFHNATLISLPSRTPSFSWAYLSRGL